jgi:hypothetical protein
MNPDILGRKAVLTTENWPLQIIYLAYPGRFIYNKRTSQISSVHLDSMVVVFLLCIGYWCEWVFFEKNSCTKLTVDAW